jgi:hypothetical protein
MIYSFIDTETEEEFELEMTYDQLKAFLESNPRFNQTFRMNIVDPVGIGVTKPPSDFQKYVLGKVAAAPGAQTSAIDRRWSRKREW